MHGPGLGGLLPSLPAVVGEDGSVEWHGWHYRDYDEDVLRYFPGAHVMIRPSPLAEAVVLAYWRGSVLCYAVAEELRHEDGSCRPYWFPYPASVNECGDTYQFPLPPLTHFLEWKSIPSYP